MGKIGMVTSAFFRVVAVRAAIAGRMQRRRSVRFAEQQAENFEGLNGPTGISDRARIGALLPGRHGVTQILFPRLGQKLIAEFAEQFGPHARSLSSELLCPVIASYTRSSRCSNFSRTSGGCRPSGRSRDGRRRGGAVRCLLELPVGGVGPWTHGRRRPQGRIRHRRGGLSHILIRPVDCLCCLELRRSRS